MAAHLTHSYTHRLRKPYLSSDAADERHLPLAPVHRGASVSLFGALGHLCRAGCVWSLLLKRPIQPTNSVCVSVCTDELPQHPNYYNTKAKQSGWRSRNRPAYQPMRREQVNTAGGHERRRRVCEQRPPQAGGGTAPSIGFNVIRKLYTHTQIIIRRRRWRRRMIIMLIMKKPIQERDTISVFYGSASIRSGLDLFWQVKDCLLLTSRCMKSYESKNLNNPNIFRTLQTCQTDD